MEGATTEKAPPLGHPTSGIPHWQDNSHFLIWNRTFLSLRLHITGSWIFATKLIRVVTVFTFNSVFRTQVKMHSFGNKSCWFQWESLTNKDHDLKTASHANNFPTGKELSSTQQVLYMSAVFCLNYLCTSIPVYKSNIYGRLSRVKNYHIWFEFKLFA